MFRKLALVICVCVSALSAQIFDVAGIRPQAPNDTGFFVRLPNNGQFTANGIDTRTLLMFAFDVQENQLSGGPSWLPTQKWNVEARSDSRTLHNSDETRVMLQHLLEDRLALKYHRQTAERPAYILTVVKGGPKFKQSKPNEPTNIRISADSIGLESAPLARMTQILSSSLGRPVVDRTGLTGSYDLSLQWDDAPVTAAPQAPDPDNHGSIFTAINEQLGLRLDSRRAPVEIIVIDHIEKPSPN